MQIDPTLQALFLIGIGAFIPEVLRLIRTRGEKQATQGNALTGMEERYEERFKTIFRRLDQQDSRHDDLSEKVVKVCDQLSNFCGRFDMLFEAGRSGAMARRASGATER